MKRQSWTEFRKNIEKVIKEFGLSDKLKSVNITQIENIDRKFMQSFVEGGKQSAKFYGWIWEYLKDEISWGKHSPDYKKPRKLSDIQPAVLMKIYILYLPRHTGKKKNSGIMKAEQMQ